MPRPYVIGLLTLTLCLAASCKKARNAADRTLFGDDPYPEVPGSAAATFLAPSSGAASLSMSAVIAAMAIGEQEAAATGQSLRGIPLTDDAAFVAEVEQATVALLQTNAAAKESHEPTAFEQPEVTFFDNARASLSFTGNYDPSGETVDLSPNSWQSKEVITVSGMETLPVRDQGQRSTCASFAGVGQIEHVLIKKYGQQLANIDLSEQRFYFMSRSDLWSKEGGETNIDGGSNSGDGYAMSYGWQGKTVPSQQNSDFNIPLEEDCPYNGLPGDNELQIPQSSTCRRGAVKIKSFTGWMTEDAGEIKTAQEIFNTLRDFDLPVVVGTILTENWMTNDGIITYAKSQEPGNGPHAGGHAYLIVGAKKVDEAAFPGEGGMCFIIKNSWGTGWGVGGYSCMTLKWFNHYRRPYRHTAVYDATVDLNHYNATQGVPVVATTLPEPTPEATLPTSSDDEVQTPEELVTAPAVISDPGDPALPTVLEPVEAATQAPTQQILENGFTVARLASRAGGFTKSLYKSEGNSLLLRGVHKGEAGVTQDLSLGLRDGEVLTYEFANRGSKDIGKIEGDTLYLCSGTYGEVCILNFEATTNSLVVGLTEGEFYNYQADANAPYKELLTLQGYAIEFSHAGGTFADFRLKIAGENTNPLRLKVRPLSGDIIYKGQSVGNYLDLALCSGTFKEICRFVVNKKDRQLHIFFKA